METPTHTYTHTNHFVLSQHQPASSSTPSSLLFLHLSLTLPLQFMKLIHLTQTFIFRIWHLFNIQWGLPYRHPQYLFLRLFFLLLPTQTTKLVLISNPFFFSQPFGSFMFSDACYRSISMSLSEFRFKFSTEICSGDFLWSLRFISCRRFSSFEGWEIRPEFFFALFRSSVPSFGICSKLFLNLFWPPQIHFSWEKRGFEALNFLLVL